VAGAEKDVVEDRGEDGGADRRADPLNGLHRPAGCTGHLHRHVLQGQRHVG
jgi:hypothetical protein